ncbi:hypothetical protein [uncultured Jatrophihabitans sp.]|uniref:hypothetical protein n=1 Tax=uncultured Jatrophihabitans sp. TaxID=1610747 RepID=UPI0035C94435
MSTRVAPPVGYRNGSVLPRAVWLAGFGAVGAAVRLGAGLAAARGAADVVAAILGAAASEPLGRVDDGAAGVVVGRIVPPDRGAEIVAAGGEADAGVVVAMDVEPAVGRGARYAGREVGVAADGRPAESAAGLLLAAWLIPMATTTHPPTAAVTTAVESARRTLMWSVCQL